MRLQRRGHWFDPSTAHSSNMQVRRGVHQILGPSAALARGPWTASGPRAGLPGECASLRAASLYPLADAAAPLPVASLLSPRVRAGDTIRCIPEGPSSRDVGCRYKKYRQFIASNVEQTRREIFLDPVAVELLQLVHGQTSPGRLQSPPQGPGSHALPDGSSGEKSYL